MLWHGCIGNPRQYHRRGFALRLQEILDYYGVILSNEEVLCKLFNIFNRKPY